MNNTIAITALICLISTAGVWGCAEEPVSKEIIYVGTFADRGSEGLYVYEFDRETSQLTWIQTVSNREGPNFQAIHPDGTFLYSVSRTAFSDENDYETISAYQIDRQTGELTLINEQSVEGKGPAHVSVDPLGRFAYVANYSAGNLSVFEINRDGSLEKAVDVRQHEGSSVHPQRQQAPHVHASDPSPDGRFLYVSDLGLDEVKIYEIDRTTGNLTPAETPYFKNTQGAGPRHFTFHPNGNFAYSLEELSSTIAVLSVDQVTGALEQIQRVNMLPDDYEGDHSAADVHVSPDGRFLYASNRGHDSLVIYAIDETSGELNLVGHEPTRGGHPRNFMIDKRGEFIFVANRDDDNVVIFKRDLETGELIYTGEEVQVPMAVCVTQLVLK